MLIKFKLLPALVTMLLCKTAGFAQTDHSHHGHTGLPDGDTLRSDELKEVIILSQRTVSDKSVKPLATLDSYLEKAGAINMIRRGSYAWEPFLNGMASERSVVTIDGMRIYAACTDKMDPVTSYVEITNLARAGVHNGQSGSTGGATIAGTLNLERKKSDFSGAGFSGKVFTGFEANNSQKIAGTNLSWSDKRFFADADLTYRKAGNYRAGKDEEILYSQFGKLNASAIAGFRLSEHQQIEASVIYDRATDVGYPALTMDVSLAEAFIGSVEYTRHHISPKISLWQTKLYYNDVTHVMDDTKRPVVPIRMDMPGWSKTAGFYSAASGTAGKHDWKANLSGHRNQSLAEMTMYPNNPGEKEMFMLTWPDVHTYYGDLFAQDTYRISDRLKTTISGGLALHNNRLNSLFGLESLQIFYPGIPKSKTRLLKRLSAALQYEKANWQYSFGSAYGDRAPSVSEGYGFYLFNSFDRFDYIGNPEMKNEKSVSLNGAAAYGKAAFSAKLSASFFHLRDYIIGRPAEGLSVMTIGAAGVKIYEQLPHANLFNTSLDANYQVTSRWLWSSRLSYRRGAGAGIRNLPLIQPFGYSSGITYTGKSFSAEAAVNGAASQDRFNPEFGESALPAYAVLNLSASQAFRFGEQSLSLKAGVENILDKNYTTFSDWNRIPRMGRNIFANLVWEF